MKPTAVMLVAFSSFATEIRAETVDAGAPTRVILVTLDGVRRDELRNPAIFHKLQRRTDGRTTEFEVSTPTLISLPAYQSIFVGTLTACDSNECAAVSDETFPERIARQLRLQPAQVAVFASWQRLGRAVARDGGGLHVDVERGVDDGPAPPWRNARFDHATWVKASRYLAEVKPRFLFLSFNDADEWGHRGNRAEYEAACRRYDTWLDELLTREKDAIVIITTDHGRGEGPEWTSHGPRFPSAKSIWLWSRGLPNGVTLRNHLDLRPTIEALFGL